MSILSAAMRAATAQLFPEVLISQEADFAPMCDLESGEFSSSVAIEIARAQKRDANGIAHQIIAAMPPEIVGVARSDSGYIVCTKLPRDVVMAELRTDVQEALASEARGCRRIHCLVPDVTEPVYARIRLIARVSMQALLSVVYEGRCRVCFEPEPPVEVTSIAELVHVFRSTVERVLGAESESRLTFSHSPVGMVTEPTFVWTSHHYHDRLPVAERRMLSEARLQGTITLRMPEDAWLLSRDRVRLDLLERRSLERVIGKLSSDSAWLRFLFHSASSVLSGDFDPAVALFDEFASPLYSLRVLVDRYARFNQKFPLPVARDLIRASVAEIEMDRTFVLRSLCMPIYTARAIRKGEVEEWCVALEDLTRRGHRFINAPKTRLALEHGELSGGIGEIVASLGFGLSSILVLATEGSCADR